MINFKKAVSVVVLFSFVLCSCGDKGLLGRGGKSYSKDKEKEKKEECSKEASLLFSLAEELNLHEEECGSKSFNCLENTECGKKCNKEETEYKKCVKNCQHEVNTAADVKSCEDTFLTCEQSLNELKSKVEEKLKTMRNKCVTNADFSTHPAYTQSRVTLYAVEKAFKGKEEYLLYKYDKVVQLLARQVLTNEMSPEDALKKVEKRVKGLPKAVEIIEETKFNEEVLVPGKVGLVYFFATWCGHCKKFAPTADALASIYGETAKIYKVDAEKNKALADKHGVTGYPTLFLLEDKELTKIEDSRDRDIDKLKGRIDEALSKQNKKEKPT